MNDAFRIQVTALENATSPLIAFFHAQRTGGSVVKNFLRKAYGDERVYAQQTVPSYKHWPEISELDLVGKDVFAGHCNYDSRDFLDRSVLPISIVRHPVYRCFSLHEYCKNKEGHNLQEMARSHTAEAFYKEGSRLKPGYFRNMQCRRICGKPSAELAIHFIESKYFAISTTDSLSSFSQRLIDIFRWNIEPLSAKAPDKERYDRLISTEFKQLVLADNEEDDKLFAFVKSI